MKTLLIAGAVPGQQHVGGLLLADMIAQIPPHSISCVCVAGLAEQANVPRADVPLTFIRSPDEVRYRSRLGAAGPVLDMMWRKSARRRWLAATARKVTTLARDLSVERLWLVLDSPTLIELSALIQSQLCVPVYAQVWDDVAYLCRRSGLDRWSRNSVQRAFGRILQNARRTAVICETMADDYTRNYGAKCIVVRQGVEGTSRARLAPANSSEFQIGMAGSLYSSSAWYSLLEALDRLQWRLAGKEVSLRVIGADLHLTRRGASRVEFLGWRSQSEVMQLLVDCDLLYLPQPFEHHLFELARLSFPTKLSTYVATGRPVFVHAPQYASVVDFCRRYPIGPTSSSLDASAVAALLSDFAASTDACASASRISEVVGQTVLSRDAFRNGFAKFLDWPVPAPREQTYQGGSVKERPVAASPGAAHHSNGQRVAPDLAQDSTSRRRRPQVKATEHGCSSA